MKNSVLSELITIINSEFITRVRLYSRTDIESSDFVLSIISFSEHLNTTQSANSYKYDRANKDDISKMMVINLHLNE